jgi:hypothetical protein
VVRALITIHFDGYFTTASLLRGIMLTAVWLFVAFSFTTRSVALAFALALAFAALAFAFALA